MPVSDRGVAKAASRARDGKMGRKVMAYTAEQVRVISHPANASGRDFVVGDLHGYLEPLCALLDRVAFDGERDRLFSVGDLVDRGPDSEDCLGLLAEPWFFPVLGNHDVFLTAAVDGLQEPAYEPAGVGAMGGEGALRRLWALNGGDWAVPHMAQRGGSQVLQAAAQRLADIPHVRVVGHGRQRFQVVHAELLDALSGEVLEDAETDALDGTDIAGWCGPEGVFALPMLWSRALMTGVPATGCARPERSALTVCGHTPVDEPLQRANHLNIDTGAFLGGSLTLYEPAEQAVYGQSAG